MSIPLPVTEKTLTVTMLFYGGKRRAQKVKVKGNRAGGVREFLAKKFEIGVDRIVICEVYRNKIFSIVGQDRDDESLATTDVWMAYEVTTELPKVENGPSSRFGSNYNRADSSVTTVKITQKLRYGAKGKRLH